MGEMADWIIEQGMDEWDAHERGECEAGCPYCPDETYPGASGRPSREGGEGS